MICLCLTGATLEEWTGQIQRNRQWISMVELRVDLLRPAERSVDAIERWWRENQTGLPGILTVRRVQDQGKWEGDDAQRLFLLSRLLDALEPQFLDLELDRQNHPDWAQLVRRHEDRGGTVIRSFHGPVADAEEIAQLSARLAANSREIPKLAIIPSSLTDTVWLLRAAREFQRRMPGRRGVWISMGEYGLISRTAPAVFGSAWTYSSDASSESAAPGQTDPKTLFELYRVNEARPDWSVYAVVGSPIAHSISPEYHNSRLRSDLVEAVYVPVRADRFDEFRLLADEVPIVGVSVTVPHKRAALELASAAGQGGASELAVSVGAANTLVRDAEGRWWADNTDVLGLMEPLKTLFGGDGGAPREARVAVVIGAGGAARAAVVGLWSAGWRVEVYNRTPSRAEELLADLGMDPALAHPMSELRTRASGTFDLLVQTTPVGMSHFSDDDPSEGYTFAGTEVVYDLVYTPRETSLLRRAAAAGCRTLNGEGMFQLQAQQQYERFLPARPSEA
jgi:3-dehydroquinate dehydratase / shikimate dehydrogenase